MEVILLGLDDLDDLVCAFAQIAERLRWPSLKIAFSAALFLVVVQVAALPEAWGPLLSSVSLAGLVFWALGSWVVARNTLTTIG